MIPAGEIPDFLWFCCGVEIFIINKIKPHAGFCCGFSDHLLLEKNINIVYHRLFYFCPFLFTSQISNYCFFFCLIPAYHFLFNLSSINPHPFHFLRRRLCSNVFSPPSCCCSEPVSGNNNYPSQRGTNVHRTRRWHSDQVPTFA